MIFLKLVLTKMFFLNEIWKFWPMCLPAVSSSPLFAFFCHSGSHKCTFDWMFGEEKKLSLFNESFVSTLLFFPAGWIQNVAIWPSWLIFRPEYRRNCVNENVMSTPLILCSKQILCISQAGWIQWLLISKKVIDEADCFC